MRKIIEERIDLSDFGFGCNGTVHYSDDGVGGVKNTVRIEFTSDRYAPTDDGNDGFTLTLYGDQERLSFLAALAMLYEKHYKPDVPE